MAGPVGPPVEVEATSTWSAAEATVVEHQCFALRSDRERRHEGDVSYVVKAAACPTKIITTGPPAAKARAIEQVASGAGSGAEAPYVRHMSSWATTKRKPLTNQGFPVFLVEAAGIEPASKSSLRSANHTFLP